MNPYKSDYAISPATGFCRLEGFVPEAAWELWFSWDAEGSCVPLIERQQALALAGREHEEELMVKIGTGGGGGGSSDGGG